LQGWFASRDLISPASFRSGLTLTTSTVTSNARHCRSVFCLRTHFVRIPAASDPRIKLQIAQQTLNQRRVSRDTILRRTLKLRALDETARLIRDELAAFARHRFDRTANPQRLFSTVAIHDSDYLLSWSPNRTSP
jgi:hypothetical protein